MSVTNVGVVVQNMDENMSRTGEQLAYYHYLQERTSATIAAVKKNRPLQLWRVAIHAVSDCSLDCSFCNAQRYTERLSYIVRDTMFYGRTVRQRRSSNLLRKIIEEASHMRVHHFHFTGGEVTLLEDLPSLISIASNGGASTSIVTNGTSPNAQSNQYQQSLIASGLGAIAVSVTAPSCSVTGISNRISIVNLPAMRFAQSIIEKSPQGGDGPMVYIHLVVDRRNLFNITDCVSDLAALGVKDVKLLLVKKNNKRKLTRIDYLRFQRSVLPEALALAEQAGFSMLAHDMRTILGGDDEMITHVVHGRYYLPFLGPCYLCMSELSIASDGKVFPCMYHLWDGSEGTGQSVISTGLSEIWSQYKPYHNIDKVICRDNCTREIVDTNRGISEALDKEKYSGCNIS